MLITLVTQYQTFSSLPFGSEQRAPPASPPPHLLRSIPPTTPGTVWLPWQLHPPLEEGRRKRAQAAAQGPDHRRRVVGAENYRRAAPTTASTRTRTVQQDDLEHASGGCCERACVKINVLLKVDIHIVVKMQRRGTRVGKLLRVRPDLLLDWGSKNPLRLNKPGV